MAAKYWVGGTGNLDGSDTTHISDTDGGAGGATYPAVGDDLIFNANSGGGTVTVTAAVGMKSVTCGAFTGSFVGNSQTLALQTFNGSGSGTRTINIDNTTINLSGDNAWTLSTVTNLTFSATGSTINLTGGGAFQGGSKTYGTVNITQNFTFTLNNMSCVNLSHTAGAVTTAYLSLASNITVTGSWNFTGNAANKRTNIVSNSAGTTRTITNTGATGTWGNVNFSKDVVFSAGPKVVTTGTVVPTALESEIVAGGQTIILTLTAETWAASGAAFDDVRQDIINGLDSAQAEATGWDAEIKAKIPVTDVVRTSDTVVTITLSAEAAYAITADETITVSVPYTALTAGGAFVSLPTFAITNEIPVAWNIFGDEGMVS